MEEGTERAADIKRRPPRNFYGQKRLSYALPAAVQRLLVLLQAAPRRKLARPANGTISVPIARKRAVSAAANHLDEMLNQLAPLPLPPPAPRHRAGKGLQRSLHPRAHVQICICPWVFAAH